MWVLHLDQPEKYGVRVVGPELEMRLAEILHGGSIDSLRKAALHVASGGTVVVEGPVGEALELSRGSKPPSAPSQGSVRKRSKRAL